MTNGIWYYLSHLISCKICKIRKQDYNYKNHSIIVLEDTDFTETLTKATKIWKLAAMSVED